MRVTGSKTRPMAMVSTLTLMGPNTKENGRRTSKMATGLSHGLTRLAMKATTVVARSKEWVNSHGQMARTMRVNLWTITSMGTVSARI